MAKPQVFTIGYEGADVDRFLGTLKDAGVETLADVRAVALSRKRGFSKSALRDALASREIGYQHFIKLGTPKEGRQAARQFPHAQVVEVPNAGHAPELEATGCAASIISDFIRNQRLGDTSCLAKIPPVPVN